MLWSVNECIKHKLNKFYCEVSGKKLGTKTERKIAMKKLLMATAGAALLASSAYAVTQGTVGKKSTGSLAVSLEIRENLKVSNLEDIQLNTADGTSVAYHVTGKDMSGTSPICAHYNNSKNANVVLDSNGSAGTFQFSSTGGTNGTIPYTVALDLAGGDSFGTSVSAGVAQPITNADPDDDNCGTGTSNNLAVRVTVANSDIVADAPPNGTYTDTLNITLQP